MSLFWEMSLANQDLSTLGSYCYQSYRWLPWWLRRLSDCLQCGRPGFNPWVRKIPWRKKWQSTPVLLPGKSHGQRSLVGYSPWGPKESDTTERLHFHFQAYFMDWTEFFHSDLVPWDFYFSLFHTCLLSLF